MPPDALLAFVWPEGMAYETFIAPNLPRIAPVARRDLVYETEDGYVIVSTVALREWQGFCRAADKPEWLEDPRFQDAAGLVSHAAERIEMIAEVLQTRTTGAWLEGLDREDVPCAPVLTRDDVHLHPQVQANGILVESEHPAAGLMRQPRPAEEMDGTPSAIRRPAPLLGEHTDEILAEFGFGDDEISRLHPTGGSGPGP